MPKLPRNQQVRTVIVRATDKRPILVKTPLGIVTIRSRRDRENRTLLHVTAYPKVNRRPNGQPPIVYVGRPEITLVKLNKVDVAEEQARQNRILHKRRRAMSLARKKRWAKKTNARTRSRGVRKASSRK